MNNLIELAKAEYESLNKELKEAEEKVAKLKDRIRPIGIYLKEVGIIEKETRNRAK